MYQYIIDRFGNKNVSYILTLGTIQDRGSIDVLAKGLNYSDLGKVKEIKNQFDEIFKKYSKVIMEEVNLEELEGATASSPNFDDFELYKSRIVNSHKLSIITNQKLLWDKLREDNKELFYYFDGIKGTIISKGSHPSGMIGSPITLFDNMGVFYKGGDENFPISFCGMKAVDSLNYVKFDILGLKTIGIMQDTYKLLNKKWEYAHEIDWDDEDVWNDMLTCQYGIFQMEGDYAYDLLSQYKPRVINDMSLINASLRPSGKSYRDRLINHEFNKTPSKEIDELLKDNHGFLVFQEDSIKFLTDICGFSGSLADTTRRAIGKKDSALLKEQLPKILEGYCNHSSKPRAESEQEAKEFVQIISDSSEYQFGLNHSTGYSMNGYMSSRLRYYYPLEFTTAYLSNAENEVDTNNGMALAKLKNITINPPKFRYSKAEYMCDKDNNAIYKGIASIKFLNESVANQLYDLRDKSFSTFTELLRYVMINTSADFRQIRILTRLNYFSEFGKNKKLLAVIDNYESKLKNKSLKDKTVEKRMIELIDLEQTIDNKSLDIKEQLEYEVEYLGTPITTKDTLPESICCVIDIDTKYTPRVKLYCLKNGNIETMKCLKTDIKKLPFGEFSIIRKKGTKEKARRKLVNDEWVVLEDKEIYLSSWDIVM